MPVDVTMPRLSDTMQQGTIVKWNVKEGQKVKSGDVIADIETDKATMELQSFDDGTVASLVVPEGQTVPVGTLMMVLATGNEDPAQVKSGRGQGAAGGGNAAGGNAGAGSARAGQEASAGARGGEPVRAAKQGVGFSEAENVGAAVLDTPPDRNTRDFAQGGSSNGAPRDGHDNGRVFASPLARKIAAEANIDLGALQGTGPGGRIVRKDVEEAIAGGSRRAPQPQAATHPAPSAPVLPQRPAPVPQAGAALQGQLVPLSNMRRVIATRLVESKQTIPHYQVTVDVDMDPLMSLRGQLNEQLASQGVKLSVNDFLVKACALAMHQHPFVNARWAQKGNDVAIEQLAEVNIGMAIALPVERGGGLVVATLRNVDQIGLRAISAQSKQLADKARSKGLSPQEMSDSTFTISNLGMFGVSHFTAIINPPNAAILAVGAAIEKPVVKNGQIVVGHVMSMTMSSDHRIIDGAMAAQYLATVRELLEKPATLLV